MSQSHTNVWELPLERIDKSALLQILQVKGTDRLALFQRADAVRAERMGQSVFLRGIVEFSNICGNDCLYCGIRASNSHVHRYRMSPDEIMEVAHQMVSWQQLTIVLQGGETPTPKQDQMLGELVQRIKRETPLAVTLSAGNRSHEVYAWWKECGMDRYFMRFETSDPKLFATLRPGTTLAERLVCLRDLHSLGVQVGSGFMIGLPGETLDTLANNILLCRELDLDMIGMGPFIPHADTPLGHSQNVYHDDPEMFFVVLAALRLCNPDAHIPATTAFDAVFPNSGRDLMLQRGSNVFMPNSTPTAYRKEYQLYPNKPGVDNTGDEAAHATLDRIQSLGRSIGASQGHSIKQKGT